MDFYSMTDNGIETELGSRLKSLRLRKNITQQQLSEATALSLNAIKALEKGRGKLSTLIAVLRELGALQELDNLVPAPTVSPLQLAKMQGRKRRRASGSRGSAEVQDIPEW